MKANMGYTDRLVRIGAAIMVGVLYFSDVITGKVAIGLLAIAAVFILTSLVSVCPLYLPFGISTKRKNRHLINEDLLK